MRSVLLRKFIGFGGIGAAMTLLSMLMIAACNELLKWNPQLSYLVAYVTTLLLSYCLNSLWVFHSPLSLKKLFGYCSTYVGGMILGMLLLAGLQRLLPAWNPTLLSYAVIPVTMIWNFVFINKILSRESEVVND